jgi:hypothetical protein
MSKAGALSLFVVLCMLMLCSASHVTLVASLATWQVVGAALSRILFAVFKHLSIGSSVRQLLHKHATHHWQAEGEWYRPCTACLEVKETPLVQIRLDEVEEKPFGRPVCIWAEKPFWAQCQE